MKFFFFLKFLKSFSFLNFENLNLILQFELEIHVLLSIQLLDGSCHLAWETLLLLLDDSGSQINWGSRSCISHRSILFSSWVGGILKAGCYRELWDGALNIHMREDGGRYLLPFLTCFNLTSNQSLLQWSSLIWTKSWHFHILSYKYNYNPSSQAGVKFDQFNVETINCICQHTLPCSRLKLDFLW